MSTPVPFQAWNIDTLSHFCLGLGAGAWEARMPPTTSCFQALWSLVSSLASPGSQEEPRGARRSQEEPGRAKRPRGARRNQKESGAARRNQEEPGTSRVAHQIGP